VRQGRQGKSNLPLIAQGRSNAAIAHRLVVTASETADQADTSDAVHDTKPQTSHIN